MWYKTNGFRLCVAILIGIIVFLLPRPEGSQFKISGDPDKILAQKTAEHFIIVNDVKAKKQDHAEDQSYILKASAPGTLEARAAFLTQTAAALNLENVTVDYVDGLSPKAKRFLAILSVLIFLFVFEPIPLEITALLIGFALVAFQITDVKSAWAPYMHPVVVFIMCCLVYAIALDRAGLTKRLGYFIIRKAGNSVTRFTFIITIGLGYASMFMHDAAACAIGLAVMIPMMKAVGIEPHSKTAKFMLLSLPFAASSGGMGTLVGGGRCMVSAAFLKEFTGIEISFLDWMLYAMPAALICVPAAVLIVYMVYRPDPNIKLPDFKEDLGAFTRIEKKTMAIIGFSFLLWITKGIHGIDYSVTGVLGIAGLVLFKVMGWRDINDNLEWGTAIFIFGGGLSLGLAMDHSGSAAYFANLFFPLIQGKGWLILFVGVGVFGALVTNAMANVAAAALILPIVIPMAQLEGINPTILALCMGMATSFAMLLVIGCPPNAIAYSYRYFKSSDLTKVGAVATPILLSLLVLVAVTWWKILGLV